VTKPIGARPADMRSSVDFWGALGPKALSPSPVLSCSSWSCWRWRRCAPESCTEIVLESGVQLAANASSAASCRTCSGISPASGGPGNVGAISGRPGG